MATINKVTSNGWGTIQYFDTDLGTFAVSRMEHLDKNGNPRYIIQPEGYINELPPIRGMRRNNEKQWYTTQSYDIEGDMQYFLKELEKQIVKGHRLYMNESEAFKQLRKDLTNMFRVRR